MSMFFSILFHILCFLIKKNQKLATKLLILELWIFWCVNLCNLYPQCSFEIFKVDYFCLFTPITGLTHLSCNGDREM